LGFEKTLNLAQQSLVTSLISRGVTCDADNQLTSVLQHKHPHELLDSVVKERVVEIFRLSRGAHSTAASVAVKRLF
jgi:hypothetical protein